MSDYIDPKKRAHYLDPRENRWLRQGESSSVPGTMDFAGFYPRGAPIGGESTSKYDSGLDETMRQWRESMAETPDDGPVEVPEIPETPPVGGSDSKIDYVNILIPLPGLDSFKTKPKDYFHKDICEIPPNNHKSFDNEPYPRITPEQMKALTDSYKDKSLYPKNIDLDKPLYRKLKIDLDNYNDLF